MRIFELSVSGTNLERLSAIFEDNMPYAHANKTNLQTHIFINEKHYFRSDGLLVTTVIINYSQSNQAHIQLIVGGGGSGLFSLDWNLEKNRFNELIGFLKAVGEQENWTINFLKDYSVEDYEE